jgi:hypothetical protein
VDADAPAGGNGTSRLPFNTFTAATLSGPAGNGDLDDADDYIFLHGAVAAITTGIGLEANQHLIGEAAGLVINRVLNGNPAPVTLVPANAAQRPLISVPTAGSAVAINAAVANEVTGLALGSTINAIDLTTAMPLSGAATLTIANNVINGAGAEGIDINLSLGTTGTLALTIASNTWNLAGTHIGNAVDITRSGGTLNLNFSNNTFIKSNAAAVLINGGAVGNMNITGFANNSVHQSTLGSGVSISNVTFDADTAAGGFQQVNGGTLAIGVSGDPVGAAGMTLTTVQGNLSFSDLDVFAGSSGLTATGTGGGLTFAVTPQSSGGTSTINAANGAGVDFSTATLDLRLSSLTVTTSTAGVSLNALAAGSQFSAPTGSSITKSSGAGTAFSVSGSNVAVAYAGSLNVTSGAGVSLTGNNAASTFTFNGGMTLSTGANAGFVATGGGTVAVTDPVGPTDNTIVTSSGTALNVSSMNIGASGLTFASITATGAAPNGVVLSSTSGNFTVTGATNLGTAGGSGPTGVGISIVNHSTGTISFGTVSIQRRGSTGIFVDNADGTAVGFGATTIPNQNNAGGYGIRIEDSSAAVTFASATIDNANVVTPQSDPGGDGIPDNDGDGDAVFLTNNSGGFTLNGGALSNCGNDCIDLRNASALVLVGVNISAPGQDSTGGGQGFGGHGIWANNLTGTSSITGGTISGFNVGNRDGMNLTNSVSTALALTIHGTTFQNAVGNRGLGISGGGTANITVTVGGATDNPATNVTFQNIRGTALQSTAGAGLGSTATVNLTVQHTTFRNAPLDGKNNLIAGVVEAGKSNVIIRDNTFSDVFETASTGEALISIGNDGLLNGNQLDLTIERNTINNVGSAASNCAGGSVRCNGPFATIQVFIDDQANVPNTLTIADNTITNTQQGGITVDMANAGANASNVAVRITNNCVGKFRSGATCTGADAPVGVGAGAANFSGIRVERRRAGAKTANALIDGNTVRAGNGTNQGTLNTPAIFARTQADTTMALTVTNNNVDTTMLTAAEMRFITNSPVAGDPTTQTMCIDVNTNVFSAGSELRLDENVGTLNVEQASSAALAAANGGVTVNVAAGTPSFGVACAAPPP